MIPKTIEQFGMELALQPWPCDRTISDLLLIKAKRIRAEGRPLTSDPLFCDLRDHGVIMLSDENFSVCGCFKAAAVEVGGGT